MRTRRAYLVTTGAVFGLIVAAHVMRLVLEGPQLAMDPWFILLTVALARSTSSCRMARLAMARRWARSAASGADPVTA